METNTNEVCGRLHTHICTYFNKMIAHRTELRNYLLVKLTKRLTFSGGLGKKREQGWRILFILVKPGHRDTFVDCQKKRLDQAQH